MKNYTSSLGDKTVRREKWKGVPIISSERKNSIKERRSYENGWSKKSATLTWDILSYQAEINLQMTQKATDYTICMQRVSMIRVRIELEVVRCGKDEDE